MTVAFVDYPNKRIYLDASTITGDFDTLDVYRDVRALRRTNEDHRKFEPIIFAGGNIPKTAARFTPAYVRLVSGCRIVPYNTSHSLKLIRDTFSDDEVAGRDCFDRSSLSPTVEVDIDVDIQEVEIRVVSTGGSALTGPEHDRLFALPQRTLEADERAAVLAGATAAAQADQLTEDRFKELTFERSNTVENGRITEYVAGGDVVVDVEYDSEGVPTSETVRP